MEHKSKDPIIFTNEDDSFDSDEFLEEIPLILPPIRKNSPKAPKRKIEIIEIDLSN